MISCCGNGGCEDSVESLIIIGGGSAAFSAATRAVELGAKKVTIINDGLPTGGTCVNVGCVPSKTLIRAAESLHRATHNRFAGIKTSGILTDFSAVIEEKRQLVADLRQAKYVNVIQDLPQVRLVKGHAKLLDARSVQVGEMRLSADHILIATGATAGIPNIPGLSEAGYLTNESAFELETLPESLIVLGGRYIALECAQMFARLGSHVTVLQRSNRILPAESEDITNALTGYLIEEGLEILTAVAVERVHRGKQGVVVRAKSMVKVGNLPPRKFLWPPAVDPTPVIWAWKMPACCLMTAAIFKSVQRCKPRCPAFGRREMYWDRICLSTRRPTKARWR